MKKYSLILLFSMFLIGNAAFAQTLKDNKFKQVKQQQGFIENKGQIIDQNYKLNPSVKYLLNMPGLNVQLKANSFSYDAYVIERHKKAKKTDTGIPGDIEPDDITLRFHRIDIEFIGANTSPQILAEEPAIDYMNYFTTGTPEGGITYVHHYGKITYKDLYPGIDLVFYSRPGTTKPVEYNFIVSPGADLSLIQWEYKGSKGIKLMDGTIQLKTAHGLLKESIPHSFEKETGKTVALNYKMSEKWVFAFDAKDYNRNSTLIIDPIPNLLWATYFGGALEESGVTVKTDASGNLYIAGHTVSTSGIATTGAYQTSYGGGTYDVFVAKFNSSGARQWSTYYGGALYDITRDMIINSSNEIIVCGNTTSTTNIATTGAQQTTFGGGTYDAFIVKFSSAGALLWGTYYGGSADDYPLGLTLDNSGNIIIGGETNSSGNISTTGSFQPSISSGYDAFIAKFTTNGVRLWGTYFGGSGSYDIGYSIAADASGNIFLVGYMGTTTGIATTGAYQTTFNGGTYDVVLAKFDPSGARLWATYYGGTGTDYSMDICTDNSGNVYFTGYTASTTSIATSGAFQTTNAGGANDGYLAKFSSSGSIIWATFYGGTGDDCSRGVKIDGIGNVYITGYTPSTTGMSTSGTYQPAYGGGTNDGFLAKFNSSGTRLWGSYFGGALEDQALNFDIDPNNKIILIGRTVSTSGIATTGAYQTSNAGGTYDAFLAVFEDKVYINDAGITAINSPGTPITPGTTNVTTTIKNFGTDTLRSAALRWSVNGTLQTSPSNWTGALAKNATDGPITMGSYNFGTGYYTIKAWTNSPNGIADSNGFNDTSSFTLISCTPANGTYVIDKNGTGDFLSISAAVGYIASCGVAGPTTFRVKSGTYTEQVTIPAIFGASATNKIIFESYNLDSTSVNLTYAANGTTDNWVLRLNGCSYVTFRKMTMTATGTANGIVVEFINAANYNSLENNIIQTLITTSTTYAGVYSSTTLEQNNTIKNNVITGGYYGIYWYGTSATSLEVGNIIDGNTIKDFYYYGIYTAYQNAVKIRKNTIVTQPAAGVANGIYATSCNNNIEFTQNNIQLLASSTIYGITLNTCLGTTTLRGNVSNNFVNTLGSSVGTIYGIYLATASYQDLNFNSVSISNKVPASTAVNSRALYVTAGTASTVNVLNNNFVNLGDGYAIYTGSATPCLGTCNYNNLFTTGTCLGYWTSNNANLAAWRTASSKDANSLSINPGYFSSTNLHLNSIGINGMGNTVSGFTVDIDGDTRLNPPDIGADEFDLIANDAGISALAAPVPPCPGSNTVLAKVKNYGTAPLTSITVGWSVNGVTQTPAPFTVSLTQNQEATLNIGSYSFSIGTTYNVKLWTYQPNGISDGNVRNDTFLYNNLATALGGTMTIGGSTANYPTIMAAINDLQAKGICSPIILKIKSGIYTGRVVIPPIPGANATNTVTLDGGSADSTKLVYSTTTSTVYAVVVLNGADYINIKNLTIENTNVTYACGVHFGNKADYNTIENCVINLGNTSTSSYAVPIMGSISEASPTGVGDMGNYNTIRNNRLIGGYYGIRIFGTSTAVQSLGNRFIGNTIEQFYYYGTYFYYQKNLLFQYNRVIRPRYAYAYGVYANYIYNSIFDANIINPGAYGMMIYYNYNVAPDSSVFSNNIITNFLNGTYQVGLYVYSNYRCHFLNNSIWTDGTYTTTTSYGCVYNYGTTGCAFKNNIFKTTGNLPCYTTSGATQAPGSIDYNNYVVSSTATVAYTGSYYATLLLWRAADQTQNANSFTLEPRFVAYSDLHLQTTAPMMLGKKMDFPNDVDGDYRCAISTTLGADEYHYTALPPTAGFISSDSSCENSPLYFWNTASSNDVTKNIWLLNGVLKSTSLNFSYTPNTTGVDTISLITGNCFGSDTFTKTVNVVKPTQTPVSEFVSLKNRVKIGELLRLSDLTTECPSSWNWAITPDSTLDLVTGLRQPSYTFLNGTSLTSANPEIQFNYSGLYDVALISSNIIGTGTTETKHNYISVVFSGSMCIGSDATDEPEGFLYDNGGKNLNYTANKLCTYTIHPCASIVSISFTRFILTSGDYLRIYDGSNSQGTPLWNKKLYKYGLGNAVLASYPATTDVFTAKSGSLYIEFETDATLTAEGFEAIWTSTTSNFSPPVASFTSADSNCNGSHVFFENTSTGKDNKYFWDFDNSGQYESNLLNPYWIYKADGKYTVKLAVVNCGGTDTATKQITIFTSLNKPTFDFEASNQRPNLAKEIVYLSGFPLTDCIDTFSWFITPNSYTIVSGDLNSQTLGIIFNDSVCYDVKLISGYRGMMDTVVYSCYILPIEYCTPNFSYVTPDIGISRVAFAEIDQASESGVNPYEDFTNIKTALLEYGVTYPFTVSRNTNYNYIQRKIWIDYNIDGDFNDPGELVANDTLSITSTWKGSFTVPLTARLGLSRLRVGVSAFNQQLGPCSILLEGEYEDYSVLISKNVSPPVITLIGARVIHVQQCDTYIDSGATAWDNVNGNITANIFTSGFVDTKLPGTYFIRYNIINVFGINAHEVVRTVIVDPDILAPEFMLIGKIFDTILVHNNFTDPGYIASDSCAGLDTVEINSYQNIHLLGSYEINYKAIDRNGNYVILTRHITVFDTIAPVVTVFDPDTIIMEVNTALNPRVLKITDNYNTTFSIVTTGTFYQNFNTGLATSIGVYTIIYTVKDESGNTTVKIFWVKVGDQTDPTIILKGSRIISLCLYDTLDEKGFIAEDNIDPNPKVTRSGSYLTDYMIHFGVGTYEIKYTVTDFSGNYSSVSRLIYVIDNGPCVTSIQNALNNDFKVYPNPSSGLLNIEIAGNEKTTVEVFNMLGKMVYSGIYQDNKLVQLDLSNFSTGIYNVQLISNGVKRNTNINIIH